MEQSAKLFKKGEFEGKLIVELLTDPIGALIGLVGMGIGLALGFFSGVLTGEIIISIFALIVWIAITNGATEASKNREIKIIIKLE